MINVFRALNPFNILWLGIVLIVLRISYLVLPPNHIEFTFVEPFARLLIPVNYENFFTPVNNLLIAAVMIFIQALWLNQMVNKYSLLGRPTFLPALMYVTVSALFTDFLILSPPLICNFLILWMIDKLLKLYDPTSAKTTTFDLGMIVGIGTLIYFPYIYMFLAVWVGLVIFRPFNWREWVSVLMGFITIFFFLAVFYYMNDRIDQFYKIWLPLGHSFPNKVNINYYQYIVLIPVIVILALGIFRLRGNFFKSYVQIRKAFQLLTVIFIITALSFYVKTNFRLSHFILCAIPACTMMAYYFLYATKRWFYETLYLLLIIGIIYFQFNNF
ncbi:DUF6427 family protein [Mucilaginibacter paludis]|uniref:Beta-carotene 15,15'-monooxygenase n=1 Tax=Mucilaginibacter paludis DSM 18603 TaxID=714943 RepID=H1YDB4_9SPHI|nr:DUF6427 family protein [Mucilaginibacter paludis]EHQ27140.1 hypothetical protein Mucpa_3035 [Mucilaginibacter paludis DSM 18603]